MPLGITIEDAVEINEAWFASRCDGTWENSFGVKIETTDNPGWWLTLDDCFADDASLAPIIGPLLREHGAQVSSDGMSIRVFAKTLANCLIAAAVVLQETQGMRFERDRRPSDH